MMAPQLIGQDPLAIERHFYMMAANIPTVSGVDIALWDLAGKITGFPIYRLLGGPIGKTFRFTRMAVRGTCSTRRSVRRGQIR